MPATNPVFDFVVRSNNMSVFSLKTGMKLLYQFFLAIIIF